MQKETGGVCTECYETCSSLATLKRLAGNVGMMGFTIVGFYREYWGYIGIMEKKMETTIGFSVQCLGFRDLPVSPSRYNSTVPTP